MKNSPLLGRNWDGKRLDIERASHECVCTCCGKTYIEHPMDPQELDWLGQPYIHVLCDGRRVKL